MNGTTCGTCSAGPLTGRLLSVSHMPPTSSPLSLFQTSSCLKTPAGAFPFPSLISTSSELCGSRSHMESIRTYSRVQGLRSPVTCALLAAQSTFLGCSSSSFHSFLPSLVPTPFSRRNLGQKLRSVKEPLVTQSTSDEMGESRPEVLRRVVSADADQVDGGGSPFELYERSDIEDDSSSTKSRSPSTQAPQKGQLKNRITFGLIIGFSALGIVLAGGWVFTIAVAAAIWVATGEYFDLVQSKAMTRGMEAPPPIATKTCSAICAAMPLMTLYFGGRVGVAMTTASFLLAIVLLVQRHPRFSQLSSAIFGLFYCGYLPCFWIKLRCGLAVPAINTKLASVWPVLLGGQALWTVGLLATIISMSTIIAADTGAFIGGRALGRTPLNEVSPKKTLEGAAVGLSAAVAVAVVLARLLQWPSSILSAAAMAVLVFVASLFGDLTESMIKRDAGVKDSGKLIPGHGGILDRVDSYVFTGALVYSFVKIGIPLFGV